MISVDAQLHYSCTENMLKLISSFVAIKFVWDSNKFTFIDKPVGLATTFEGFSTFAAKPLINIHDIAVLPDYRGRGD